MSGLQTREQVANEIRRGRTSIVYGFTQGQLVELIDPTCTVDGSVLLDDGTHEISLSCGHVIQAPEERDISYCPECGRRVVSGV